ncbi:MAG: hypothetical protein EBU84_08445, partial [Actinobacteria bacterium]|nr:hypothetical protein [Actinomycetota bacterium]
MGKHYENLILVLLLLVAALTRLRNLNSPITGSYTFRYTQTAWGIRSVARGVNSPFSIETPVLGPPWKIPFEFPLFQLLAGVTSRVTNLDPQVTGRLTSLAFFLLTALIFFRILRYFVSSSVGLVALTVFLFCAHNLEYGSAVLIEYCALFFGLLAFLVSIRYLKNGHPSQLVLFVVIAAIAGLVKITTSFLWVGLGAVAVAYLLKSSRKMTVSLFIAASVSQVPAFLWTRWADNEKASSIWTSWLTSESLSVWNFGTFRQRLYYFDWHRSMITEFFPSVLGSSTVVIVILVLAVSIKASCKSAMAFLGLFLAGPLIFTNLYFVHDYYWTAVLPSLLLTLAIGIDNLLKNKQIQGLSAFLNSRTFGAFIVTALITSSWFSEHGTRHFDHFARPGRIDLNTSNDLIAVEELRTYTKPSDRILVVGADWNPSILYFADRKGLMLREGLTEDQQEELVQTIDLYQYVLLVSDRDRTSSNWSFLARRFNETQISAKLFTIAE